MARQLILLAFRTLVTAAIGGSFGLSFGLPLVLVATPKAEAAATRTLKPTTLFNRYKDAIVRIEVFLSGASLGVGTGFYISRSGEIATNLHVVRPYLVHPGTSIEVRLANGAIIREVQIGACGDSRGIDLCVLKTASVPRAILPIEKRLPRPGEALVTIGHPRGLNFSISRGIVSGVRRHPSGWHEVQTDTAISPGNSGGPLINEHGRVVGVVYQFERDGQNLNFGILAADLLTFTADAKTFLPTRKARKRHFQEASIEARQTIEKRIRPALRWLSSARDNERRERNFSGLRWVTVHLGKQSFRTLIPNSIQNCERMDESDSAFATVCQSIGGEWSVTFQKRPRTLDKPLDAFTGLTLVEPRPLAAIEQLRTDGRGPASDTPVFESRPGPARCDRQFLKDSARSSAVFDELGRHSYCHFDTTNDGDPGAASNSVWIDDGTDFYGINVWTADPARLSLAAEIARLIVASASKPPNTVLAPSRAAR